jgi:hypothetical protein
MSVPRCIISGMTKYVIERPLTAELALKDSPVRKFFDDRLTPGLRDAQAAYRVGAGQMLIPGVPREEADPGTIGTATDWLMRFLVHPSPTLVLAAHGASVCRMLPALKELAFMLGYQNGGAEAFTGPARGSGAEPSLLHRACWALALLTEVYRRGPEIVLNGPLGRLRDKSARSLLDAAPAAGLGQLAALRRALESGLLPAVADRPGLWAPGPVLAGSALMAGDCDLVAGGLLVELKTTIKKPSLGVPGIWQLLGYSLMDYVDEFRIRQVAIFHARYGYLAQWDLDELLSQLAGRPVSATELRAEFRELLEACQPE